MYMYVLACLYVCLCMSVGVYKHICMSGGQRITMYPSECVCVLSGFVVVVVKLTQAWED